MNIAIIIGVSNYGGSNDLPACKIDADIVYHLFRLTGKFEKILYIADRTTANEVKDRVVKFIDENKGQAIDEVVFYFTGHGEFYEDEYYYLMSDYNSGKRKTTTLQNTELDNMLRALNPRLTAKLVDACNAGVTYVKADNALEKYVKQSQSSFNNCYFLFSSQQKQFSYQDDKLSDFTRSFLTSIKEHSLPTIRYKNIIDYVSDYFDGNDQQTPLFIAQADFTEIFCDISKEVTVFLKDRLDESASVPSGEEKHLLPSIEAFVRGEAAIYCTKAEAVDIVNGVPALVERHKPDVLLDVLYAYEMHQDLSFDSLPRISGVGQWLSDNKNNYFARPTYTTEAYEDYEEDYSRSPRLLVGLAHGGDRKKVTKHRRVVAGLTLTEDLPFNHIEVIANSLYPNLESFCLHLVFLLSRTEIRFFSFTSSFLETGWDSRKIRSDIKWKTTSVKLKDSAALELTVKNIVDGFKSEISAYVHDKYNASQQTTQEAEKPK